MIEALLCSGLVGFLNPTPPSPPPFFPPWPTVEADHFRLKQSNKVWNFKGRYYELGNIPSVVEEYGKPALHVFSTNTTVRNFYWQGSMEGLHVGSQPFTGQGMRNKHAAIRVTLDRIFCRDIGEDCVSIQPRSKVTLTNSEFQGNFGLKSPEGPNPPGFDKIMQIDGAEVLIENCTFRNGFTAIRGKANSRITLRNCNFIDCKNAVTGDGLANPRVGQEYDNGKAGLCKIVVENCRFWHCETLFHAAANCEIHTKNCIGYRSWNWNKSDKGKVFGK